MEKLLQYANRDKIKENVVFAMGMLKWVLIIVDLLYIIFVLIPRIW
ncbi:MAG: hypothetical protein LBD88_01215 [Candidatus Peribacteria bacterium]|nr:hypothetical protein [Candidatus Peribacteria bacterium]